MTTETLTFCPECGARVTDWTDGECPDSTDKRHGPLKDVRYAPEARIAELEAAIEDYLLWEPGRRGHAAAHRELQAALKGEEAK